MQDEEALELLAARRELPERLGAGIELPSQLRLGVRFARTCARAPIAESIAVALRSADMLRPDAS